MTFGSTTYAETTQRKNREQLNFIIFIFLVELFVIYCCRAVCFFSSSLLRFASFLNECFFLWSSFVVLQFILFSFFFYSLANTKSRHWANNEFLGHNAWPKCSHSWMTYSPSNSRNTMQLVRLDWIDMMNIQIN